MNEETRDDAGRSETKREQLRRKVAESEASLSRQLPERDPPEGYRALVMDYPFALLLGGLALGVLAGGLMPRSAARKLARGALAAAGAAGELGRVYGRQALDAAEELSGEGRGKLGTIGEKIADLGERVSELGETVMKGAAPSARKAADLAGQAASGTGAAAAKAADRAGDAADSLRENGIKIARQVIRLTSQLRH